MLFLAGVQGIIAYCVVAVDSAGREIPMAFLERVKEDFNKRYSGGKAATAQANSLNKEFGYEMVNQRGNPPISISNDRQVSNFVGYAKKGSSTTLCVTFSCSGTGAKEKERVNIDLNKEPCDSSNVEDGEVLT
ncbi:hypothetical protein Bca52824_028652 [Brassica carinata]|uniref:Longin domain-containing protein n=1 Tax=Brassica carinata TaxID=52824 RepID=A0A8X8AN67_BRACI|nr:hypothetical protein Bca52824_028652 [Brassica carinata]